MFLFSTPMFFIPFNSPMLYLVHCLQDLQHLLSLCYLFLSLSLVEISLAWFLCLFEALYDYSPPTPDQLHIHFNTFFLTIYKNLFLWAELSAMIYSSCVYIYMQVYKFLFISPYHTGLYSTRNFT